MENAVMVLLAFAYVGIQSYTLYFASRHRLFFMEAYWELWAVRPYRMACKLAKIILNNN